MEIISPSSMSKLKNQNTKTMKETYDIARKRRKKTIPNLLEARCRYEREHSGSLLRDWHRTILTL